MLPPLGDCLVRLYARTGPAHRQPTCSVRVPLCTCCALCAIKHMTQKHWCVHAAREGVKTHRYAVLKGCWERDIVRPPAPVQITPELPTITMFYSRVARNLVGSREKKCGDDLNTAVGISLPRWSGMWWVIRWGYHHSPSWMNKLLAFKLINWYYQLGMDISGKNNVRKFLGSKHYLIIIQKSQSSPTCTHA